MEQALGTAILGPYTKLDDATVSCHKNFYNLLGWAKTEKNKNNFTDF